MTREQLIIDFFKAYEELATGTEDSLKHREETINKKYNKITQDLNLPFYEEVPNIDPFIQVYDKVLPDNVCDHLINIHNSNSMHLSDGITTGEEELVRSVGEKRNSRTNVLWKVSKDLHLSDDTLPFEKENQVLHNITSYYIQNYIRKLHFMYGSDLSDGIISTFQIQ